MAAEKADDPGLPPQAIGCLIGLAVLPVFPIFAYFGQAERGLLVMVFLGGFGTTLYATRSFPKERYFPVTTITLFLIEFPCALFLPLPWVKFDRSLALLIVLAVFVLNFGVVWVVRRLFATTQE